MKAYKLLGLILVIVLLAPAVIACGEEEAAPTPEPPAYWPTEGWRTSTPEEQGMDSELLAEALDFLQEHRGEYHLHSLLVVRHGYVVADVSFYPFAPEMTHDLTSATKSFTSTLIGIAIDKGYIEGVEQPVIDIFPERTLANVDASKTAMTVEDLLTMRSGFECISESEAGAVGGGTQAEMMESPDWAQFTLDLPMSDEPGERFKYCNPVPHLLSAIIQETTGLSTLAFAQEHLFGPLGISDVSWPSDPQGNNHGWGDLYLTPHDMAKLGYLYLNEGLWDDQRVLSASWVDAATSIPGSVSLKDGEPAYGYLWWLLPDSYRADGRDGQMIHVFPEQDIVVVHAGGGGTKFAGPDSYEREGNILTPTMVKELLIPYVVQAAESETPLPANPNGVALLESKIQQAAAAPEAKPAPPLSDTALAVSGKTYAMDANPLGISAISLTSQDEEEALLQITFGGMLQLEIRVGLDDVYRLSSGYLRNPDTLAAARGTWASDGVFSAEYDTLGNIDRWQLELSFEGDEVTLQMESIAGQFGQSSFTVGGRQI
jgi:CubicO group peptidase (beta-lactamase class C family)